VVPARNAAATICATLEALAGQRTDAPDEVIVVDDGSDDGTAELAARGPGEVTVLRGDGRGAAEARNLGARAASGEVLAFTDSDCVPDDGWLTAGLRALEDADLVQGPITPIPGAPHGPFDRSLWVEHESGLHESANLIVRRELFERVGGFEGWLDHAGGRPIGEDTWFGWRARRSGARAVWAPDAVVHHAVFPRSAREFVAERLRLQYFPAMVARMPELRHYLFRRWFLTRRSAAFDLAFAAAGVACARRSRLPLVAALPYAVELGRAARPWRRRAPAMAAATLAADAVACASLIRGSLRSRAPLL
jgi:glycosyltransferase involved in cell wall biosynthesis